MYSEKALQGRFCLLWVLRQIEVFASCRVCCVWVWSRSLDNEEALAQVLGGGGGETWQCDLIVLYN